MPSSSFQVILPTFLLCALYCLGSPATQANSKKEGLHQPSALEKVQSKSVPKPLKASVDHQRPKTFNFGKGITVNTHTLNATNDVIFQQYKRLSVAWKEHPSFESDRPIIHLSVNQQGQLVNAKVFSSNGNTHAEAALLAKLKGQFPMRAFPHAYKGGNFSLFLTQRDAKLIRGLQASSEMSRLRTPNCNTQEYRIGLNQEFSKHFNYSCSVSKAKNQGISARFFADSRTGAVRLYEILTPSKDPVLNNKLIDASSEMFGKSFGSLAHCTRFSLQAVNADMGFVCQ